MASASLQPKVDTAAAFQATIRRFVSTSTMASRAASMICRACTGRSGLAREVASPARGTAVVCIAPAWPFRRSSRPRRTLNSTLLRAHRDGGSASDPRHQVGKPGLDCARERGGEPVKQFVRFRTARGEFAIPVESVREVRSDPLLATIPGAHPAVAGLLDWKGEALTVVEVFGSGRQLIVLDGGPRVYGLLVEEVP